MKNLWMVVIGFTAAVWTLLTDKEQAMQFDYDCGNGEIQ